MSGTFNEVVIPAEAGIQCAARPRRRVCWRRTTPLSRWPIQESARR